MIVGFENENSGESIRTRNLEEPVTLFVLLSHP
jgi:hypothetical protein